MIFTDPNKSYSLEKDEEQYLGYLQALGGVSLVFTQSSRVWSVSFSEKLISRRLWPDYDQFAYSELRVIFADVSEIVWNLHQIKAKKKLYIVTLKARVNATKFTEMNLKPFFGKSTKNVDVTFKTSFVLMSTIRTQIWWDLYDIISYESLDLEVYFFWFFWFWCCEIKSALKTNGEIWQKESWRPLGVSKEQTDQTLKLLE